MNKVLIRSGLNYNKINSISDDDLIHADLMGSNIGNGIYLKSVFNFFRNRGIDADADGYLPERIYLDSKRIDYINGNYDAYILPLADAFRKDYIPHLKKLIYFIERLKIPVIVPGVCVRCYYDPGQNIGHSFDEEVKHFINSILKTGGYIGARGYITADYLTKLGFKENSDFDVIGCPSIFMNETPILKLKKDAKDKKINEIDFAINYSHRTPNNIINKLNDILLQNKDSIYFLQHTEDQNYSINRVINLNNIPEGYLNENALERSLLIPEPNQWIDTISHQEFSLGTRFHGNVTALLAGVPALIIMLDSRMRELCEYFDLPRVTVEEFSEKTFYAHQKLDSNYFNDIDISKQYERYINFWLKFI